MPATDARSGRWRDGRPIRLTVLASGLLLAACADPPTDWSLTGRIGETTTLDTNRALDPDSEGLLVTTGIDTGFSLAGQSKRSRFGADLDVASRYFLGETDRISEPFRIDPRLSLNADYLGKTYTLSSRASVMTRSTALSSFDDVFDPGAIDGGIDDLDDAFNTTADDATQITATLGTGLALDLDPQNRMTFDLDARQVEFTDDDAGRTPTRTIRYTVGWNREITPTSTMTLSAGVRHFAADDAEDTRSQTLDLKAGLTHQRTPRHRFRISGGASAVRTWSDAPDDPDLAIRFIGDAGFDYSLKSLTAGIALSQNVAPSSEEGALRSYTQLTGNMNYAVNSRESLGAMMSYARRAALSGGGDVDQLLSIGPSYNFALTQDTQLSLGYFYRMNIDDASGNADGHRVFLSVSHNFDVW